MKKLMLVLTMVVFLVVGCAARRHRQEQEIRKIYAKTALIEYFTEAEQAQTAYLDCLEKATSLDECAVLKEIANERIGIFLYWHKEWKETYETKEVTITVKKPWWQVLLERGRGGRTKNEVHPPQPLIYQTPKK